MRSTREGGQQGHSAERSWGLPTGSRCPEHGGRSSRRSSGTGAQRSASTGRCCQGFLERGEPLSAVRPLGLSVQLISEILCLRDKGAVAGGWRGSWRACAQARSPGGSAWGQTGDRRRPPPSREKIGLPRLLSRTICMIQILCSESVCWEGFLPPRPGLPFSANEAAVWVQSSRSRTCLASAEPMPGRMRGGCPRGRWP